MSWEITILAIPSVEIPLEEVIPDVFFDVEETVSFEEASSAAMGSNLAAGRHEGWTFVLDNWHRISNHEEYLADLSKKSELLVFRISENPYFSRWKAGKCVVETESADSMAEDLDKLSSTPPSRDPESVSQAFFGAMTGIQFPFPEATFNRFTLD